MKRILSFLGRVAPLLGFHSSRQYWEARYRMGGHSGEGSRGENARYKADVINDFVGKHAIASVVEFGCGDGHQLQMLEIPRYIGVDVSKTILDQCRKMYAGDASKSFLLDQDYRGEQGDLSMSIDVIFHLVEDEVYDEYMARLFAAANRYVIVYSTSTDMSSTGTPHVRHRNVVADVSQRFPQFVRLLGEEKDLPPPVRFDRGLPTTFFLYERRGDSETPLAH